MVVSTKKIKRSQKQQNSSSKHVLKILSLILSVTLWFYVLNSEPLEVERRVEIVFITPTDLAINVEIPKFIKVKIKGSRAFVQNLDLTQEKMIIDLRDYPYNQETFPVTFDHTMINLPFGIEVLEIAPQQVVLSMEREIKKMVPVRLRTVGDVGEDLRLTRKDFTPKEFMIRGPYTAIKKIGLLNTLPIDLESLDNSGEMKLKLEPIDGRVTIEELKDINFYYTIRPNKANRTLSNFEISFLSPKVNYRSEVKNVNIDVLVSSEKEPYFEESEVLVVANLVGLKKGRHRVPLKAELPEGVNLLSLTPEYIEVIID